MLRSDRRSLSHQAINWFVWFWRLSSQSGPSTQMTPHSWCLTSSPPRRGSATPTCPQQVRPSLWRVLHLQRPPASHHTCHTPHTSSQGRAAGPVVQNGGTPWLSGARAQPGPLLWPHPELEAPIPHPVSPRHPSPFFPGPCHSSDMRDRVLDGEAGAWLQTGRSECKWPVKGDRREKAGARVGHEPQSGCCCRRKRRASRPLSLGAAGPLGLPCLHLPAHRAGGPAPAVTADLAPHPLPLQPHTPSSRHRHPQSQEGLFSL